MRSEIMVVYALPVQISRIEAVGYRAECPELQGCFVDGDSLEEVRTDIQEAISLHIQSRRGLGLPLPEPLSDPATTILTVIPVAVA